MISFISSSASLNFLSLIKTSLPFQPPLMSGAINADISANIASMSGRFGCFSANDLYSSLFRSFLSFFTFLIPLYFFLAFVCFLL